MRPADSYAVEAKFGNVGGLKVGAPVTMAGVRIGRVESIKLEQSDYMVVVTLAIERRYDDIPDDSDAAILTSGLLGGNYIGIAPGGSEKYLRAGSEIYFTQSAIAIESLINEFLANFAGKHTGNDSQ